MSVSNVKTALVTGGATGIGKATALCLMNNGYDVTITCHKTEPDYNVKAVKCDLKNVGEIEALFGTFNSLDLLVNNAGVSQIKMINDVTPADYENMMAVNLRSVYFACKEATKLMVKNHTGAIVNISSMWGEVGASCETLYSTAKAGVIGLTKALAKELAPSGITVNAVTPGIIDTRMNAEFDLNELQRDVPLGRIGTAEDVARAVLFLAENSYITGQILGVNGGMVI